MKRFFAVLLAALLLPRLSPMPKCAATERYMAITFDDGPSGSITGRLLEGLEERGVKATFFLCGYRLETFPDVAPLIAQAGHEIGLHGFSHDSMADMDRETLLDELNRTQALLTQQTGVKATLLRPPGGCSGDLVRETAGELGLSIVTWSVDPRDWEVHDSGRICQTILQSAEDGDIILMHDMWQESVDGALAVIDALQSQGVEFVTVSRLAEIKHQSLEPGKTYGCFS